MPEKGVRMKLVLLLVIQELEDSFKKWFQFYIISIMCFILK